MTKADKAENIVSIIPKEVFIDLLGPSSKYLGEGLGGLINFTMLPFRKLNIITEKSYQDFCYKINEKTKNIPLENRDDSKLGLSIKATEDSKYQLNEEILRDQFANLIANTLDNRKNNVITPRFSTILSQLSVSDANLLFKIFLNGGCVAAKDVTFENINTRIYVIPFNFILIHYDGTFENGAASLDNLLSLGILKIQRETLVDEHHTKSYMNFDMNFKNSKIYADYFSSPENQLYNPENPTIEMIASPLAIELTDFGKSFCNVIIE